MKSFLRNRLLLWRQLRALPGWLRAAAAGLLTVRALVPVSLAVATGSLVGSLTAAGGTGHGGLGTAARALATLAALLLLGQASEAGMGYLKFAVARCVDGAHRRAVELFACTPVGIAHLEDSASQDDLLRAAGDPDNWTEGTAGQAAWGQLVLVSRYIAGVFAVVLIARDSVGIAAFLLASLAGFRSVQRRGFLTVVRTWAAGMAHRRRATYWSSLLTTAGPAKEVRVFRLSGWLERHYLEDSGRHLQPFREAKLRDAGRQWIWLTIVLAAMAACVYALAHLAVTGRITVGRLSADLTAVSLLLPLFSVTEAMLDVEAGMPRLLALQRLRQAAGVPSGPPDGSPGAAAGPGAPGQGPPLVRFEGVHFGYPGTGRAILNGLDLEIRPGEVLALVGLNGAGKTTLIKLLAGLYEPGAGRITVDGTDLRQVSATAWRGQLAMVFQDFLRYQVPARDNIALGHPAHSSEEAIRAAAEQAGIASLIDGLPAGWDTPLSPGLSGGVDLSGGQWQRVALARALLAVRAGARVLVLDEPTAHLDVRAEFDVFHEVIRMAGQVSIVLISHRMATVREADRIALIQDGRITECGGHDSLLASGGTYASIFRTQAHQFSEQAGPEPVQADGGRP